MASVSTIGRCRSASSLWMLLVFWSAISCGNSSPFAHVSPVLCGAVVMESCEVINSRLCVHPDDGIARTARFCLRFSCELVCCRGSRR